MTAIKCTKCATESETRYCPNCGNKFTPDRVRSREEIDRMKELISRALKTKTEINRKEKGKEGFLMEMMMDMLVSMTLNWARGDNVNLLDIILADEKLREYKEIQEILIEAKRYN